MAHCTKTSRKALVINRVLALSLIGTALWHRSLFSLLFQTAPWSMLGIVIILLSVLMIGSVVGLLRMSPRGYYFTYVLVPFATMFHGIALIPVITSVLPNQTFQVASVFVLNCAFLAATVVSHRSVRGSGRHRLSSAPVSP